MPDPQTTLDFLHTVEKLKDVTRHIWTSKGRHESVAEHTWRLMLFAMISEEEFPNLNMKRVYEIMLVHDLGELEGDTPAFEKTADEPDSEQKIMKKAVENLPNHLREKLIGLWTEYAEGKTEEAKFAKALDKLEALVQHNESDLSTWIPLEYKYNFIHGKEWTDKFKWTKELRKLIDDEARKKIDKGKISPK